MTLYARQQKRHRCKEQTVGLCGWRRGWDDLREYHWSMYINIWEIDHQSRFNAWDRVLGAGALGWPWGMGWGTHVHPWLIHVNVWQKPLQYFKVINNGTPLQYSCLKNPMDGGAWKAAVHGVTEGQTWLSNFTFTFHFHALEKEMATPSSVLAWRIPGTGEPGGLPSMGSHRVGHDWSDLAAAAAAAASN